MPFDPSDGTNVGREEIKTTQSGCQDAPEVGGKRARPMLAAGRRLFSLHPKAEAGPEAQR